jgi:hypothetical protein
VPPVTTQFFGTAGKEIRSFSFPPLLFREVDLEGMISMLSMMNTKLAKGEKSDEDPKIKVVY